MNINKRDIFEKYLFWLKKFDSIIFVRKWLKKETDVFQNFSIIKKKSEITEIETLAL